MTENQKCEFLEQQKRVFNWMFDVQEERLKQRGYPINNNGTRSLVINLSERQ